MTFKLLASGDAWAGSGADADLVAAIQASDAFQSAVAESRTKKDASPQPSLFENHGGVGVINVAGPLLNVVVPDYIAEMFGVTTYDRIQRSLLAAAEDKSVTSVLLNTDTGGGAVSGVAQTAKLIEYVDQQVKPVVSYAGDAMLSAGYWLGGSSRTVIASPTALTGSVGVIQVLMDATQQMESLGLKPTVMRSGEFKALGHPMEVLTEKAKQDAQGQLDAMYKVFVSHVADKRQVSYDIADKVMGQGRVFVGEDAVAAGLVDKVMHLSDLLAMKDKSLLFDLKKHNVSNGYNVQTNGGSMAKFGGINLPKVPDSLAEDAQTTDASTEAASTTASEDTGATASVLTEMLKAKDDKILGLSLQVADMNAQLAQVSDLEAVTDKLAQVVAGDANRMLVALGRAPSSFEGSSFDDLASAHAGLVTEFDAKFLSGGLTSQAAPTNEGAKATPAPEADVQHTKRVNAVSFKFKGSK
jgi:signal peptide peptidase SppA